MNPLLGLIIGMVISLVIIPIMWRLAPRLRMLDKPDPRKVHRQAIPRVGGGGIVLGALLPVLILLDLDPLVQSYLIGEYPALRALALKFITLTMPVYIIGTSLWSQMLRNSGAYRQF